MTAFTFVLLKGDMHRKYSHNMYKNEENLTFWEHLDVLRNVLVRIVLVTVTATIIAFLCKDTLFKLLLAPKEPDFYIYQLFKRLGEAWNMPAMIPADFHIRLVSTQLTSQFMAHMNMSLYVGLLVAMPYILYQLYRFISPALYKNERHYTSRIVVCAYILFMAGVLLNYFLLFPLTLRFLAGYVVSTEVQPLITLESYTDTLMMLSLAMGVVFEIPVLSWLLARLGVLKVSMLTNNRRYAVVIILIIAAVITPTSDIFTLLLVSFPIYILYELSIVVVRKNGKS